LVAVVISLPLLIASSGHAHLAPLWIPALLLIGFLAVNAWRLKRWAILCEAVLYTGSSLLNLTVLLFNIGRGGEVGFYLLVSTVNAVEFFRAFKAGVGSSDSESTKSEEI